MKLSMWILYDFLREFSPIPYIRDGKRILKGVRILSDITVNTFQNVYLDRAADYVNSEFDDRIICAHGQDLMILQTTDYRAVFNRILDCFDYYNVWEETCKNAIRSSSSSLKRLLEISEPFFMEYLSVSDETSFILDWQRCFSLDNVPAELASDVQIWEKIYTSKSLTPKTVMEIRQDMTQPIKRGVLVIQPPQCIRPSLVRALFRGNALWGFLVESNLFSMPSPVKEQHLDMLGEIIEWWLEDTQYFETTEKHFREIFRAVFNRQDKESTSLLQQHLSNLQWSKQCQKRLVCIRSRNKISVLPSVCQSLNRTNGCVAGVVGSLGYALCNLEIIEEKQFFGGLKFLLKSIDGQAVLSYTFRDLEDIFKQEKIATVALSYAENSNESLLHADAYILPYLKNIIDTYAEIDIMHPAVKIWEKYDKEHAAQLTETMYYFLLCHQNYASAGKRMFLHRNTVQYRVERAIELAKIDLDNETTCFHLLLSLYFRYMENP